MKILTSNEMVLASGCGGATVITNPTLYNLYHGRDAFWHDVFKD